MKMYSIASKRKYHDGGAHHILYEWEDVISQELKIPVKNCMPPFLSLIDKILSKLHINFLWLFRIKKLIRFQMTALAESDSYNSSAVVLLIVDFYLPQDKFTDFFNATSRNKFVFISSYEVFNKLKLHKQFDAKRYFHLPLSLPDKYKIDAQTVFEKKYDCVMLGRQDPLLESYVKKYADNHSDFTYVYREIEQGKARQGFSYYTNNGNIITSSNNHDDYVAIMRAGRVGLWSTRGLSESVCNGYNQVTPRFFELLSSGCHIICRYPKNDDTDFFEINKFCENVDTYELFEQKMDWALTHEVDMRKYSDYLEKHYTSNRALEIERVLNLN